MASQNVNVNNLNMSGTNQSGCMGPMDPINVMKQLSVLKVCTFPWMYVDRKKELKTSRVGGSLYMISAYKYNNIN